MVNVLQALSFQQRALLMTERVLGVDHPNTIPEYVGSSSFFVRDVLTISLQDFGLAYNLTCYFISA